MGGLLLFFSFLIGLSVGSFLNCLIYRLKEKELLNNKTTKPLNRLRGFFGMTIKERSYCPKCKNKLGVLDLIPVFSFIFLGGKCRYCHQKISWQYPIVELLTGVIFTVAAYQIFSLDFTEILDFRFQIFEVGRLFLLFRNWFFISVLLFIFIYDLKYYLIPDKIILPAIIITLVFNTILQYCSVLKYSPSLNLNWLFYSTNPNFLNFLFAAVIGGGFFLVQFLISKGRWIGGGDIRLGVLMGLMLGWPATLFALFLAYIIGAIIGIGLIVTGKKSWQSQIPFGPFLAGATIITLLNC